MENTKRFSNRVDNYVAYRPHYPHEIILFLQESIGLNPSWVVADIGSGTGISSELFIENGNLVYGVEPNDLMRKEAERTFSKVKNFISINSTAESTSLKEQSINLVVAGQAFHWFDQDAVKVEFNRILAPGGYTLLMWNDRALNSPFQMAYEQMLLELAVDYDKVTQRNVDINALTQFFSPRSFLSHSIVHSQYFDFKGLTGRLLSSSYAPTEDHSNYHLILKRLEEIFNMFQVNNKVEFQYTCHLYLG